MEALNGKGWVTDPPDRLPDKDDAKVRAELERKLKALSPPAP